MKQPAANIFWQRVLEIFDFNKRILRPVITLERRLCDMKEKNKGNTLVFPARLRLWLKKAFEKTAEILDDCQWYPCPRQTKQWPF